MASDRESWLSHMINSLINDQERNARFQRALALLQDGEATFTAEVLYSLSDLDGDYLEAFHEVWLAMPVERRRSLAIWLVETAETNFELDFSAIIHPALDDPDAEVRTTAIEGVLEDCPNRVIERLMDIAQNDPFASVRATATQALGQFVLQGELGKLSTHLSDRLQDTLLSLYRNFSEDLDVRRRALEAIGNCGRVGIPELIREAYYADELPMRVSAMFAMGRSCDAQWLPQIIEELSSEYPEMRYEAARAAGELELRKALPRLAELAYEDDREIQEMAIWALGEIGGQRANQVLGDLAALADSTDDDELADAVAEAQAAASLTGDVLLPLFDFADLDDFEDDEIEALSYSDLDYEEEIDEDEMIEREGDDDGPWGNEEFAR